MKMEPHIWRSTMCVFLALVEHNTARLPAALATPPGSIVGKKRFLDEMKRLNQAAGIAIHLEGARQMRDAVGYFQAVQKNLTKYTLGGSGQSDEALNAAIRQIVSEAVSSEEVVDIFGAAGLGRPDISILSDEFLENVVPLTNVCKESKSSPRLNCVESATCERQQ